MARIGDRRVDGENVLLITGGLAPPLVTETLYGLAMREGSRMGTPFWPDRVIVAGTAANRRTFAARGLDDQIDALCAAVRKSRPPLELCAPRDAASVEIDDIRTADDAEAFGTMVVRLVQELTRVPANRLHVSLAGGRKTMSFHAGAALQLYGRDQDQLSHVLLDPPEAEFAANFWYPTVGDLLLVQRDGSPLTTAAGEQINAKDVRIDLADIPFLSVRALLPETLRLKRPPNYREVMTQVSMALGETPVSVTLDPSRLEVTVPGLPAIKLAPQPFAFFQLLCEWTLEGRGGAGPEGLGGNHVGWLSDAILARPGEQAVNPASRYFEILDAAQVKGSLKSDRKRPAYTDTTVAGDADLSHSRREVNVNYFRQPRTKLSKALAEQVPNARVRDILFRDSVEEDGTVRYGVNVSAMNIFILEP